ncbi:MAG: homoserine O-succinyltransferase, partial [Methylococcaceae bacterium]
YHAGDREDYPPFPEHYFSLEVCERLSDYGRQVRSAREAAEPLPVLNEAAVLPCLDNTWRDTAKAVFNNWLGLIYQVTDQDRRKPLMDGVNPANPLGLEL